MEDKHHPLRGAEAFEHDEEGQPDFVIESHPVGGIDGRRAAVAVSGLGHVLRPFATR
jgi:hypothetical protein